jgi:hypothetical protein
VVALGAVLLLKRIDSASVRNTILDKARDWGNKVVRFSRRKDRLMNDFQRPNGEAVCTDLYDRQFYQAGTDKRFY